MRQFFVVWYGHIIAAQIVDLVGTSEATIRQKMVNNLWKVPGVCRVDGYTPGETETMINHGVMKTYPIPTKA